MKNNKRIAIITGSAQGIGLGIAQKLAKNGIDIVVSDINYNKCLQAAKIVRRAGATAIAVKCDVSKKSEVARLIDRAINTFGRIDILINNAGMYPFKPFDKMTESDWDKVINVNLKGTFLCSQKAAKHVELGGKIVNISSVASFKAFPSLAHYCASKGGVNAFTRSLALELASRKINVNAIAPGAIETPGAKTDEKTKKQTISMIPWNRMGKPEDIANLVNFLISAEADYITGQIITVDGGWTIH